jgi:hypothetical protein
MILAQHRESSTTKCTSFINNLKFANIPADEIEGTAFKLGISLGESSNKNKKSIA